MTRNEEAARVPPAMPLCPKGELLWLVRMSICDFSNANISQFPLTRR